MTKINKKIKKNKRYGKDRKIAKRTALSRSGAKKEAAKETKQSFRTVMSNNLFLIKLVMSASPGFVIFPVLDSIRNQVSIYFEHTVGIGYVLEAAEFGYPFRKVALVILALFLAISLGMVFTVWVGDYVQEKNRPKVREKIKLMLYEKAQDLDLECYDNPKYYDEMVLAISEVDNQIDRCVTFLQNLFSGLATFITSSIYFLNRDKLSVMFAIGSFILTFLFTMIYNKISYKIRIERNPHERERDYVKRVFYLPDYAKELRLNPNVNDLLMERFEKANKDVYDAEKKYAKKHFAIGYLRNYISNDFVSDVLYISYLVMLAAVRKVLSFSSVAILFNNFGRLKRSLRVFTDTYPFAAETSLYVTKIRKFLEYDKKIVAEGELEPVPGEAGRLDVKSLSFGYDADAAPILNDISMTIKPGEKIALVGYNGAGKTTLVKLLMRLYDPDSGEIRLNGENIRRYDVEKYRNSIGVVFQDFHIFAGTVADNVVMNGEAAYDAEAVTRALTESGLMPRVSEMEDGLDSQLTTEIMEKGINLSGGEAQKLAVSRVFYQQAGLMILDEPSSALDPIAEYQLNHAMVNATKDKTVIFISHRLSTTRLADRIIMLEKGRIVETGTHDELLARGGKYAEMWRVQAGAYI